MCQLLGLSFSQDINPNVSFSALLSRSRQHPDGWGLVHYPSNCNSAAVFKEPVTGSDSNLAAFLCRYAELKSKIFIGHIRKATRGSLSLDNTHPFTRCYYGREYSFAHNGTLFDRARLNKLSYQPIGDTDSERGFCYLLSQLRNYEIKPSQRGRIVEYDDMEFRLIHEILLDINTRTAGIFNCVFSDGKYLFCYRDLAEARNLFYREHHYNIGKNGTSKISMNNFSSMENPDSIKGYIVATEPLDNQLWTSFLAGHLIVFCDGNIVANLS